ncbi:hypothetical protein [Microvirga puerhi]|uniref:Uncharacterized protein n=1 Tax=Microvirga puerhi TaxID=2876078 RepID=A0ABS7VT79_9HYPH|nr:hypothetical protein [Microvirga puerhi]MBZ6078769.1 hypothetical protein [Microvirga puerhi]
MTPIGDDPHKARSNLPPLPRQVQDYLGQKLRAQLYEMAPKPKYLGDPAIPQEFDALIEKIERREQATRSEQVARIAQQAVEEALKGLLDASRVTLSKS